MANRFVFTVFILIVMNASFSQSKRSIDSLRYELSIAKDDTSRINQQAFLCLLYRLGNSDSSLFYGQQALNAAHKIDYPKGEVLALQFMSITLEQMGNLPKALETAFKAIEIAKANKLEDYSGALNAVGEVYIVLKDYPKALSYLQEQKLQCEADGNIESLGYAKKDMAIAFEEMDQFDSAMFYVQQAMKDFEKINREEPQLYEIGGNIKMKTGNKAEALNLYQKSLQVSLKNNERRTSSSAYIKLASFYKDNGQTDSAIYYARKGLEESKSISQKQTIQEAATLLSALFETNDINQSIRYLKIADAYKDSLFGASNLQAIQTLVAQSEEHQKEIAVAKINFQNKLKVYALLALLSILFVAALILYRNNRQKQKANKVLQTTLTELKATQQQLIQSEKMASLGELTAGIAHEIQNPLNFVNNFSEVNKEMLEELKAERLKPNADKTLEDEIIIDIIANEEKILHHGKRADAIVKGMLQHSRASTGKKEPTNINALCEEYLRLSYHGLRAKDKTFNAEIKTDFDNSIGKINIIPQDIGRVLLNLFNNAFYAVREKAKQSEASYQPSVTVTTKKVSSNSFGADSPPAGAEALLITVKDNGVGISHNIVDKIFQPFFTTKPTGQGTGLGLSLSYDIIKAHGGEIKVESKEGEGSEFIIQLPIV